MILALLSAVVALLVAILAVTLLAVRKQPVRELALDSDAWGRWLRAGRPDLRWFLSLEPAVQQALTTAAEAWTQDLILAVAWAVLDPEAAELGAKAHDGDGDAEAALLARVTEGMRAMRGSGGGPVASHLEALERAPLDAVAASRPSDAAGGEVCMGGIGERRAARASAARTLRSGARSLFGRRPDAEVTA